jgi:hypothetical protein
MEPLLIVAIVLACLVGWVIVSFSAAFIFGRVIGRADDERRAKRAARAQAGSRASRAPAQASASGSGARDARMRLPAAGPHDAGLWGPPQPALSQSGVLSDQAPPDRATLR